MHTYIYNIYIYIYIHIICTVEHNKCIDMANFHEHIVADTSRSKKNSSALLVHEQQAPQSELASRN